MVEARQQELIDAALFDIDGTLIDTAESTRRAIVHGARLTLPQPKNADKRAWSAKLDELAVATIEIAEHRWNGKPRQGKPGTSFAAFLNNGNEAPTRPLLQRAGIGAYEALLIRPTDLRNGLHSSLQPAGRALGDKLVAFQNSIWSEAMDEHGIDPRHASEVRASTCREFLTPQTVATAPDAEKTLRELQATGIKLGIASDGLRPVQERKLRAAGLNRYFPNDNRFFSGSLGFRKGSDGLVITTALQTMGISAARTIFVGDRGIDAAEARGAGLVHKHTILCGNKPVGGERYPHDAEAAVRIPGLTLLPSKFRGTPGLANRDQSIGVAHECLSRRALYLNSL